MFGILGRAKLIPLGVYFLGHLVLVRRKTNAHLLIALKSQQEGDPVPLTPAALRAVQRLNRIVRYCGDKKLGTCLHHSLAAWRILDKRGVPARVVIAPQAPRDKPFLAHAWVEVSSGQVVGRPIADMAVFTRNDEFDLRVVRGV